jgi:hypothetical protein
MGLIHMMCIDYNPIRVDTVLAVQSPITDLLTSSLLAPCIEVALYSAVQI